MQHVSVASQNRQLTTSSTAAHIRTPKMASSKLGHTVLGSIDNLYNCAVQHKASVTKTAMTRQLDTNEIILIRPKGSKLGWSCGPSLPELLADHQIVLCGGPVVYWKLLTINFYNI